MEAQYKTDGATWDYTPSGSDVSAGDVIVIGKKVAVATADIDDGELGSVHVSGIISFTKDTGSSTAITQGARCYWDATNEVITTTSSGNTYAGLCASAASASASTVDVDINAVGDMVT